MKRSSPGVEFGLSHPLGARVDAGGVNFSVYSKHATAIDLLLFDDGDAAHPSRTIALEPPHHRTYHYWHAHVAGLAAGQVYAYRVRGPNEPGKGLRFNADKVLFDPYGRALARPKGYSRGAAKRRTAASSPSSSSGRAARPARRIRTPAGARRR